MPNYSIFKISSTILSINKNMGKEPTKYVTMTQSNKILGKMQPTCMNQTTHFIVSNIIY